MEFLAILRDAAVSDFVSATAQSIHFDPDFGTDSASTSEFPWFHVDPPFEPEVFVRGTSWNALFRDELVENPGVIDRDGNVRPLDKPGIGLEVNETFLAKHPAIEGPGYV